MAGLRGGRRGRRERGGKGGKGGPQGGYYPHLRLSLSTGAGIFLMSRDAPHWLRVSVGNCGVSGKRKGGKYMGVLFTIVSALGMAPHCF